MDLSTVNDLNNELDSTCVYFEKPWVDINIAS